MRNNSNGDEFRQYTAFARIDGAIMGGLWIASFACFIGEFSSPALGFAAFALALGSVFVGFFRLRNFRNRILGGFITFGRATVYSILTYFYAALLLAVAQYVYFQFIDNGYLMNQYVTMLSTPEYVSVVKNVYGMDAKEMIDIIQTSMSSMRPIEIAFQFLTINVILAIIISIPAGALTRRAR